MADDRSSTSRADQAADLLSEMRASVDAATHRLDELSTELAERRQQVDLLETALDALLDTTSDAVVVVAADQTVAALSRAAEAHFDQVAVGKPLDSLGHPGAVAAVLAAGSPGDGGPREGDDRTGDDRTGDDDVVRVVPLPDGGSIVVLSAQGRTVGD